MSKKIIQTKIEKLFRLAEISTVIENITSHHMGKEEILENKLYEQTKYLESVLKVIMLFEIYVSPNNQ